MTVTVYAVTSFKPDVLNGAHAARLARTAVRIFGEQAGNRELPSSVNLVIEPTLRTQDSWKLVRSIGNYCFGSGNQLNPRHIAVGSVLYTEDVKQASELGFKTVVSPMTDADVLQAAKEHKIDAVPAIGRLMDGIQLAVLCEQLGIDPTRIKVFPFSCKQTAEALIDALKGPFHRAIEAKRLQLVPDVTIEDVGSATELWAKILAAGDEETIRVGKPTRGNGLGSLTSFREFNSRFADGKSVPVVTGGIKAETGDITKLVANGVRDFGLSALITDEVQQAASGSTPSFDKLTETIGIILDCVKSGLEQST